MQTLRIFLAILVCKLTRFSLRILGRGGTNLPGTLANFIAPNLLRVLGRQVDTIIITGTNGKTTSARMMEHCLAVSGGRAFANRSGANLITGITAEYIANASLFGKMRKDTALIECDEAALKFVAPLVLPAFILVTNVFRDQLDRHGEVTHTIQNIRLGIEKAPSATVCLNADCALTTSIVRGLDNPTRYFGVDGALFGADTATAYESSRCFVCNTAFSYDYRTFGHLGAYSCPACGATRPALDVAVTSLLDALPDASVISVRVGGAAHELTVNLPGAYNIYNAAGVIALADAVGIAMADITRALAEFRGGFGRMEKLTVEGVAVRMILVKNPIGASQTLRYLADLPERKRFLICVNDKIADGTDVSWLWDVDIAPLMEALDSIEMIFAGGIRADDLALWLKYNGVPAEKITVEPDYDRILAAIAASPVPVYIMPTYTAMLALREKLAKAYDLGKFWE